MSELRKKITETRDQLRAAIKADIAGLLQSKTVPPGVREAFHVPDEEHLYALYVMGQVQELEKRLKELNLRDAFYEHLEVDRKKVMERFAAPDLGPWPDAPGNLIRELGLIPGDILVMKQHMYTPWEWQHAAMVKDDDSLYTAMCTGDVMVQSTSYFKHYAVRVKALKVKANHENPERGLAACVAAATRLGNRYGISKKRHAYTHKGSPMYCSQVAWYGWLNCGEDLALNLDHGCPDHDEIEPIEKRRKKLCSPTHDVVFPGDLAKSDQDSRLGFKAKTTCVLDICRPGYGEEAKGD